MICPLLQYKCFHMCLFTVIKSCNDFQLTFTNHFLWALCQRKAKKTDIYADCTVHSLAAALVFCTVWRVACTQDSITWHAYSCTLYASILCSLHFACEWKCNEEQSSLQIYIIDLCSGPILLFVSKEFSVSKSTYSCIGLLYKLTYQWNLTCFKCIFKS